MKYRRETLQDRVARILNRGVYGLGVFVVMLSLTQGLSGIVGVILMILLISAFIGSILWIARVFEGWFGARRGLE